MAKPDYKSGGMYSTGRAITRAPGTKKRPKFRDKDERSAAQRGLTRVTGATPSKKTSGPKSMKSADAYGNPAKKAGASKPSYKSGGMYSTGRAIPPAPGSRFKSKANKNTNKKLY